MATYAMLQRFLRSHSVRCKWKHKLPSHLERLKVIATQTGTLKREAKITNHIFHNQSLLAAALFSLGGEISFKKRIKVVFYP